MYFILVRENVILILLLCGDVSLDNGDLRGF